MRIHARLRRRTCAISLNALPARARIGKPSARTYLGKTRSSSMSRSRDIRQRAPGRGCWPAPARLTVTRHRHCAVPMDRRAIRWSRAATERCSSARGVSTGALCSSFALSNLREVTVPTETILEAGSSGNAVFDQGFASVVQLLDQRIANRKPVTLDRRATVGAHADLRETGNLLRQFFGLRACPSFGSHVFAETNVKTFSRRPLPSGQNNFQCAALTDDARQAHRSAIDQWHTPATTIDAEIGFLRHYAKIAPEAELHSAGNGGTLDCRDDRLVQLEARRTQGAAWNF